MNALHDNAEIIKKVLALTKIASTQDMPLNHQIDAACNQACGAIAPSWPLDQAIAVNPHWARIGMPLRQVAARMAVLGGIRVFPSRDILLQAWNAGRINQEDLGLALASLPAAQSAGLSDSQCHDALHRPSLIRPLPLLFDVLDNDPQRRKHLPWRQAITHQISQTCAAYFDAYQADWQPERSQGLYAFWRDTLQHDHGIGFLMGLPHLGQVVDAVPTTAQEAEHWVLQRLGLPQSLWAEYLEAVLLTVNGWASWCAYLGWQTRLNGRGYAPLRELLAIRLAWGILLLECKDDLATEQALQSLQREWSQAPERLKEAEEALLIDEVWQIALESGYQRQLAKILLVAKNDTTQQAPAAQAVFCIDVRSEPLRHALEAAWPGMQTIGFAGFFGLPLAYTPLATQARRPQLPGLFAPTLEVSDRIISPPTAQGNRDCELQQTASQARRDRLGLMERGLTPSRWPGAAFSYVEAAGLGYLATLCQWLMPSRKARTRLDLAGLPARYHATCRPQITGLDVDAKVALAAQILHALGLAQRLAPIVLLVGHGSQSSNNAHAASLDCGACCGQTGEVNARALALLLNDSAVRNGLASKGISIPGATVFVAGLHNTTTDELEWFDLDLLPDGIPAQWPRVQAAFHQACDQLRRRRAPALGLNPGDGQTQLLSRLRQRANDGAQTRPEWGLAGNAAFIIAPRSRTRGRALDGRCFLQDYEASNDADASILVQLMTGPLLVAHWINWQYHASTCEPDRLGGGNKLLHNVVGGRIGVFEGNGGDLRIGLARQSLHDGHRWVHEPLRLTVAIEASKEAIDQVLQRHQVLRNLLFNGWLHLWCLQDKQILQRTCEGWHIRHVEV